MIDFRFYLVTDRTLCAPKTLASVVHDACVCGVRAVQLREKDFAASDVVSSATRLVGLMHPQEAKLFVNVATIEDDTLALITGSPGIDGFHVPDDPDLVAHIRRTFPKHLLGASTHSAESIRAAAGAGADFVTFGPVFGTVKSQRAQGLDALSKACAAAQIPVFAIGGITPDRAKECLDAGAHGVAAIRAVMASTSARRAVREFAEAMGTL